jgi:hypothetical protein
MKAELDYRPKAEPGGKVPPSVSWLQSKTMEQATVASRRSSRYSLLRFSTGRHDEWPEHNPQQ